ncbi:MAG TPA: hypothetical protein PK869_08220 [Candidatus Hydrogenedentes bacterium]|nr:hypothetical protein [Candidatus Hydrogenedentota bacterium]
MVNPLDLFPKYLRVLAAAFLVTASFADGVALTLGPPPWNLRPHVRYGLETLAEGYMTAHPSAVVHVTDGLESFDAKTVGEADLGDIMFIPGAQIGQASILAVLAERGLIADLSDKVQEASFNKADFFPNIWPQVEIDGKTMAVPLLVRSWGMALDTSVGTSDELVDGVGDWESFVSMQSLLLDDLDGDGTADRSQVHCGLSPYSIWLSLFLGAGGNPSDPESFSPGSSAWTHASAALKAFRASNPLFFHNKPLPTAVARRESFVLRFVHDDDGGRTSYLGGGDTPPSHVLLPFPGASPIPALDCTVIAIKASTPEREQAAWEFVRWATSAPVLTELLPRFRMTPLRQSMITEETDELTRFFASQIARMRFESPRAVAHPAATALHKQLHAEWSGTGETGN